MNFVRALVVLGAVTLLAAESQGQTLTIHDDALQNSFTDESHVNAGSRDFTNLRDGVK